jgi:transcriptional regulator with XRE-family HTH domain
MLPSPPERTLHYWLTVVLEREREAKNIKFRHISSLLDVEPSTVSRFEDRETWPKNVDQYLAAYAEQLGVADPRDFYVRAIKLWRLEGQAPVVENAGDDAPTRRAQDAARQAAQTRRKKRSRGE